MPPTQPALLEARNIRIDEHGVPSVDGLSLMSQGRHVVVLGAARALFEAAIGVLAPSRGELFIRGTPAHEALLLRGVAGAPLDPPLPPKWTARRYITWSARLAGHGAADARTHTDQAIAALELGQVCDAPLKESPLVVRRATVIAAALATRPQLLVFEEPTLGLPDPFHGTLGRILARALRPMPWVAFAARAPLDAPLILEADEAIVLAGSQVLAQGAPAELAARDRLFSARLAGDVAAFATLAGLRGIRVQPGEQELTLELGESLGTRDLLELANEARAVIVELEPLHRRFVR